MRSTSLVATSRSISDAVSGLLIGTSCTMLSVSPRPVNVRNGFGGGGGADVSGVGAPCMLRCVSRTSSVSALLAPAERSTRSSSAASTVNAMRLQCLLWHLYWCASNRTLVAKRDTTCGPSVLSGLCTKWTSSSPSSTCRVLPNFSNMGRKPLSSTKRPFSENVALNRMPASGPGPLRRLWLAQVHAPAAMPKAASAAAAEQQCRHHHKNHAMQRCHGPPAPAAAAPAPEQTKATATRAAAAVAGRRRAPPAR
mmetsp:Transcript_22645/g.67419  ORF Transcript_22645/g.67419 Transcript_22645/m.67419 type:complete len:253 (-) Transcript_22645:140-898(-)